jgi:hypothetical protein
MQPTTIGLAVNKLSGMPKKVRRLLGQMLAVNPAARPQDPLAFYRQIQDCLAQVDRRESMARRFGVPFFSRSNVTELPGPRRFPGKVLAFAAILLALGTAAALILPQYLRHQRVRQAEAPIGVPIGVPDATASPPPVTANGNTTAQTNAAPQNPPPAQNNSTPVPATSEVAAAPVQPTPPSPPANVQPSEQPKIAANDANTPQATTAPPQPTESVDPQASAPRENRETEVAAAIPTARPVSPEVRRAEPAPPAEGPEEEAVTTERKVAPSRQTKKVRVAKTKRQPEQEEMPRTRLAEEDEPTEAPVSRLPGGRVRARFIGVTADGNWMFALPSKKIVIVSPPPGG